MSLGKHSEFSLTLEEMPRRSPGDNDKGPSTFSIFKDTASVPMSLNLLFLSV